MGIFLRIAGITLKINQPHFMRRLSSAEKPLLLPFISSVCSSGAITVFIQEVSPRSVNLVHAPLNPFIKSISSLFPKLPPLPLRKRFNRCIKDICSCLNARQAQKMALLFKKEAHRCKIAISRDILIVFNTRLKRCDIFIKRKFRHGKCGAQYLCALRLLYRLIFDNSLKGIMLHAAGIELNRGGHAFVGKTGIGKTTAARLAEPDRILSDDTVLIRKIRGKYMLFPNPWWNASDLANLKHVRKPVPLKAIWFIKRGTKTIARKFRYKEALAYFIYQDSSFQQTGFFDTKLGIANFFISIGDLAKIIPVFGLEIKKGPRFRTEFRRFITK